MRKLVLTTLTLALFSMASYAATFMQVKTADGKTVDYDVEEVTEVVFIEKEVVVPEDTTPVTPITPSSNHKYVDLGLPSKTLWATYNVGATSPEESGDFFAWGETETKTNYDWTTYDYAITSGNDLDSITKYNFGNEFPGVIDNQKTLLPGDDAATANWGAEWRMPTSNEFQELLNECTFYIAEINGVKGYNFVAKNGNSIFLPTTGYRYETKHSSNTMANYWSATLYEEEESTVEFLGFSIDKQGFEPYIDMTYRYQGFPVRAVRAK